MRLIKLGLLLIATLFLSSCGAMFCVPESDTALTITSEPSNADVYLNGRLVGKTPYSHFGDKVNIKKITVKKVGYNSSSEKPRKLKGWAYVNFVPYPGWNWIWGYFLDRSLSKCWYYKRNVFHFRLEEE